MTDTPVPDVRELAHAEYRSHVFVNTFTCACDFQPHTSLDWQKHVIDAVLAAVEPVIRRQVAEERTYPNVKIGDEEFEHYDRLGPGCWHPVKGNGPCLSWQGLIREAGFRAAAIARSHSTREEQDHG